MDGYLPQVAVISVISKLKACRLSGNWGNLGEELIFPGDA
jgi:hypothetical protein